MPPLTTASRALARSTVRCNTVPVRALSCSAARLDTSSSYQSPFMTETKKFPSFGKYMSKGDKSNNQLFSYFMVGALGAISAAGAKSTINGEPPFVYRNGVVTGCLHGNGEEWR